MLGRVLVRGEHPSDLEEAKDKLAEWDVAHRELPELSDLDRVLLADVIRVYHEKHAQFLQSHDTSRLISTDG